jgi:hypothetical protein
MASAPTAGANGVDPDEPAPIAQAINRLARLATASVVNAPPVILVRKCDPGYMSVVILPPAGFY